jgi:hypothetical protein
MKGFKEFIGESREESSRPVLDEILESIPRPDVLIEYFENKLGTDFLEFEVSSKNGERIQQEFSPIGWKNVSRIRYRSFLTNIGGFRFYYYELGGVAKAIRSMDGSTWWISQSELDKIEDKWFIDDMLEDF